MAATGIPKLETGPQKSGFFGALRLAYLEMKGSGRSRERAGKKAIHTGGADVAEDGLRPYVGIDRMEGRRHAGCLYFADGNQRSGFWV